MWNISFKEKESFGVCLFICLFVAYDSQEITLLMPQGDF